MKRQQKEDFWYERGKKDGREEIIEKLIELLGLNERFQPYSNGEDE